MLTLYLNSIVLPWILGMTEVLRTQLLYTLSLSRILTSKIAYFLQGLSRHRYYLAYHQAPVCWSRNKIASGVT